MKTTYEEGIYRSFLKIRAKEEQRRLDLLREYEIMRWAERPYEKKNVEARQ